MDTLVRHWDRWLILMKCACYTKGHIYPHICSVNLMTADEPPSISLCPTARGFVLFLLDVNDVYTCACGGRPPLWIAAITHDGAGPQARTQLAGQTSRHLLGVGWAAALKSLAACSDLLLDTSRFFFFIHTSPPTQELYSTGWMQA